MRTYSFYPTLLNDFRNYQMEKTWADSDFILVDEPKLLNKINKVPYPQTVAMAKGNAFEKVLQEDKLYSADGFSFDESLVDEMRIWVKGGVWQRFVQFLLPVDGARVRLYGYVDVTRRNRTIDVKTTSHYDFPGFDDYFQHHVYLLGSRAENIQVTEHLYLVTDFHDFYREPYDYLHEKMQTDLQRVCRDLIDYVELRKAEIVNPKIFE